MPPPLTRSKREKEERRSNSLCLTSRDEFSLFPFAADDSLVHLAGIFHNLYLKINEVEQRHYKGDSGWKFYIHNPLELPTLGVQTHGTSLYSGQGRDLRLDLKKVCTFGNQSRFVQN